MSLQRRYGLGLRTQILLALSVAFALSFTVLGIVVVRLSERDRQAHHLRRGQAIAEALAAGLSATESLPTADQLRKAAAEAGVVALAVQTPNGGLQEVGPVGEGVKVTAPLVHEATLHVWLQPADPARSAPLGSLLRLYLFVTGAAILLAAYILLTRLIVRPVENLTRASERLARGASSGHVPVRGAAEVVRLGVAFNRMGVELADERRALEHRLAELEAMTVELRSTQEQLIRSEKLASVGRLAAGVAHEIGNPLAAILGLLDLLRDGDLDADQQREFVDRIHEETQRIHRIIRDLLDYSRSSPEADEVEAYSDLPSVVEDAVKLVAPQKDLREVTIERRFAPDIPAVRAPSHQLTQVVLNLLLNATDAVSGEGTILIEVGPSEEGVALSVSDSGPGIAPKLLPTLFDPFVTSKPAGQGTGLGLSVSQSLVERFGGRITAANDPRGGARFTVWLQAAEPRA